MSTSRTFAAVLLCLVSMRPEGARLTTHAQLAQGASSRIDIAEQRQRGCCDAIAIDNEGRLLATKHDTEVTLWDLDTGFELRTLVPRARAISRQPAEAIASVAHSGYPGLAFDPSGRYVALTAVDNLNPRTFNRAGLLAIPHVWEVQTGHDLSAVDWTFDPVAQRTVSPVFPFDPTETLFWQATTDAAVASKLARYRGPATTFSPDGRFGIGFVSEGGPNYAYRLNGLDLDSNRELWRRRISGDVPPIATFSPDGRWVAVASWANSWILDARTGAQVADLSGANAGGTVAFSRDSRRLVIVRTNEARVFDVSEWRCVAEVRAPDDQRLRAVTFTPDSRRVVAATGEAIYVWNAISSREVRRISMDAARPVKALTISPRGRWLAAGTGSTPSALSTRTEWPSTVVMWPLEDDDSPRSLWTEEDVSILALAFSPDEQWIAGSSFAEHLSRGGPQFEGEISIRSLANSTRRALSIGRGEVRKGNYDVFPGAATKDLAFTSDGSIIVAATLGLRAYRPEGQSDREFETFPQLVLYDARTLRPRRVVDLDGSEFTALAASSDGKLLATGHDANTVRLWTTATARQRSLFRWPVSERRDVLGSALGGGSITGLAFHPDGRRLAVARDDGVALVNVVRRTRQEIVAAKDQGYSAIAFSPDGSLLVVASGTIQGQRFVDARISQWVTATMRPRWTLDLGTTEVPRLAFGPNGKWFAAATSGGVSIHDATTGAHLMTLAILATNDWLAWTPDGRYAGSPAGIARLGAVRQGTRALPLATVGRQLNLRELLEQVLP